GERRSSGVGILRFGGSSGTAAPAASHESAHIEREEGFVAVGGTVVAFVAGLIDDGAAGNHAEDFGDAVPGSEEGEVGVAAGAAGEVIAGLAGGGGELGAGPGDDQVVDGEVAAFSVELEL